MYSEYNSELFEKKIDSEEVYSGRLLHVFKDTVSLPNGNTTTREVIRHNGAVCIVPITENNEVIIEEQFRYPFNRIITELPAGKLDSANEGALDAAKRELREETGYTAKNWTYLGVYIPTCAYSTEKIYMFMACDLTRGEQQLDKDEFLRFKTVPIEQLLDDVMNNKIEDGKTQAGLLKAARILGF